MHASYISQSIYIGVWEKGSKDQEEETSNQIDKRN
jgi:hypothetical protein